ncbi:MAG: recombinase family protein [Pirellulales bacterium]
MKKKDNRKATAASSLARNQRTREFYSPLLPMMRQLRARGKSYTEIAEALNKAGHRTVQGGKFHKVAVYRILTTKGYKSVTPGLVAACKAMG